MNVETASRLIQLILAPSVLVTACGILIGSVLSRYAAVNDRVRELIRERLGLLRADRSAVSTERIGEIDAQLPLLLRRHRMLQSSSVTLYVAVMVLVMSMIAIAVGAILGTRPWGTISLLVFLAGTMVMIAGLAIVAVETRMSHDALLLEVGRIEGLHLDG